METNLKKNIIPVTINASVATVFEFSVNPDNTPSWVPTIEKETINTVVPELGTLYTNEYGTLKVTAFKENELFEISDITGEFVVRYEYKSVSPEVSTLVYSEWMVDGSVFPEPTPTTTLMKLKEVIEASINK